MSSTRRADPDRDDLITEITIDCHDEDEQLQAFENAFDEDAHFPCPGTIVGQDVEVLCAGTNASRRELIATCRRNGRTYHVALLDVNVNTDPTTSRLLAAYRRWTGVTRPDLNSYRNATRGNGLAPAAVGGGYAHPRFAR